MRHKHTWHLVSVEPQRWVGPTLDTPLHMEPETFRFICDACAEDKYVTKGEDRD